MKNTDRTLQLVTGGSHFFILVLKKQHVSMVAKWRSYFKEPRCRCSHTAHFTQYLPTRGPESKSKSHNAIVGKRGGFAISQMSCGLFPEGPLVPHEDGFWVVRGPGPLGAWTLWASPGPSMQTKTPSRERTRCWHCSSKAQWFSKNAFAMPCGHIASTLSLRTFLFFKFRR